jgi:hypothetical protein
MIGLSQASSYTGQYNTERQRHTHAVSGIRTYDPRVRTAKTRSVDRVAAVIAFALFETSCLLLLTPYLFS